MAERIENPAGLDGFEFVMFAAEDPAPLHALFHNMGLAAVGRHKRAPVTLFQAGDVRFLVARAEDGFAADFARAHGPGACAMGFHVKDSTAALATALDRGATKIVDAGDPIGAPAIGGIGGARVYLVDEALGDEIYTNDFEPITDNAPIPDTGLIEIDHLTHNVHRGQMDKWAKYYEDIFNFVQIRFFDIEGKKTGLFSKAMTSPCGKIRIPLNESQDDKSQIAEYLREYNGEGIQHIALSCRNIYDTVPAMRRSGIDFQDTPETYYELIDARLPGHGENVAALRNERILIDGGEAQGGGFLLQIFTQNVIGPIFFEIIQRKGNEGFGEGNFQALFESIELDQERRGVL